jgi:hypothetical protein
MSSNGTRYTGRERQDLERGTRDTGYGICEWGFAVRDSLRAIIIGAVVFAAIALIAVWNARPPKVQAQAPERISQQTYPFTWTWTPDTHEDTYAIPNLGQTAHTINFKAGGSNPSGCVAFFEGSNDNSHWWAMSRVPISGTAVAQGQYTFFRLDWNPSGNSACSSSTSLTIYYVGYQFVFAPPVASSPVWLQSISTPVAVLGAMDGSPMILNGIQCYNPNAAVVYLEIYDSAGSGATPSLSNEPLYAFGLAASGYTNVPTYNMQLGFGAWLAAVTTFEGTTTVSSAVSCSVQGNWSGPFL